MGEWRGEEGGGKRSGDGRTDEWMANDTLDLAPFETLHLPFIFAIDLVVAILNIVNIIIIIIIIITIIIIIIIIMILIVNQIVVRQRLGQATVAVPQNQDPAFQIPESHVPDRIHGYKPGG